MRVVVSGGGTGGHIFPALAVAESLARLDTEGDVLYIGGTTGMETQIVPERGVLYQAVTAKQVKDVLNKYLNGKKRVLIEYLPEANREGAKAPQETDKPSSSDELP